MPASRKPLPEGFEQHPTNSQEVRCIACYEANPAGAGGNWIKRLSIKAHLNTLIHTNNMESLSVQKLHTQQEQAQIDAAYSGIANMNIDSLDTDTSSSIRPSLHSTAQGSLPLWGYLDMENTRILDPETEKKNIQHQFEQILIQELFLNDTPEEDGSETNIVEALSNFGIDEELGEDPDLISMSNQDSDYFPYPNKLIMLLDLISNLPRLRLSSAHFKLILWLLRNSGVPNVPSYYAFRKMQAELQKTCGHEPQPFKSVMGNYFYVNDPRDAVKRVRYNVIPHIFQLQSSTIIWDTTIKWDK
ncbi:MAG: hypothetical protein NXY57DRAFT_970430 [Lentinula lateritia]|nr:MAG: hypothetical protein NXY57DRAFT_970430 [Lentinula lateritia]